MVINISTKNIISLNVNNISSAIMNPCTNILALQSNNNVQIFDLNIKTKIKDILINNNDNDKILYLKWLNKTTISYITNKSVYHCNMQNNGKIEKKFDILADNRAIQIIDHDASMDGNWLFVQAIAKSQNNNNSGSVEGIKIYFI